MTPETEVISCPACRHVVRVPTDWLGQTVRCPECAATFTAPVRADDRLTDPVLLTAPPAAGATAPRKRAGAALLLPAFGLTLVGFASLAANGYLAARFAGDPGAAREAAKAQFQWMRPAGFGAEEPEADRSRLDDERGADMVRTLRWVLPLAAAGGAVTLAGGLAMVFRKGYRLAQFGCVVAAVNLPHLCCVPGAAFGLWGLLMLMGDEGREHFGK